MHQANLPPTGFGQPGIQDIAVLQVLNVVKCRVSFCTCGRAPPLVVDNQVSDEIRSVPATVPPAYLLNFAIIIILQCTCTCRFNFFTTIMTTTICLTIIINVESGIRDMYIPHY